VTGVELTRLVDPASLAMLMVLSVALVALGGGRRAAIVTAVANLVIYDYLVVPPRYSFALHDAQYLVTFAVMLTVGLLIGELTTRLRFQARLASAGEQRAHALSVFSRTLSAQASLTAVIDVAERNLSRAFASPVVVIGCDDNGQLDLSDQRKRLSDVDPGLALRVFREQRVLGTDDATLAPHWVMIPVRSSMQPQGVVAMRVSSERRASLLEDVRELDTFAALIGLALERVHYVALSQDALLAIESERLRNSLLAALSHDLRTPLAGVIGLAESILYTRPSLSPQQHEMITEIVDEGRRMSASIDNLLEMAKLESGTVALRVQWQSIEEVVGSALAQTRRSLASHHVTVQVASGLPLVQFDAGLITRVLVNLLENAAKYTPPGASILIEARLLPDSIELSVADDGPGLPAGREEELFAKFARGQSESASGGVGLGLAICRSIVHAHRGRIVAEKGRLVGARLIMNLPLGDPPPMMGELESLANDN
jgi:two-component system sensor histidine kinase KdpD